MQRICTENSTTCKVPPRISPHVPMRQPDNDLECFTTTPPISSPHEELLISNGMFRVAAPPIFSLFPRITNPGIPAIVATPDPSSWSRKLPLICLSNLSRAAALCTQINDTAFGTFQIAARRVPARISSETEAAFRAKRGNYQCRIVELVV